MLTLRTLALKGRIESIEASFQGLSYGLALAVLLVYLLLVVNFQSWLDPFIILSKEVAYVVAFLASPKSVSINGDAIPVGGGALGNIYY